MHITRFIIMYMHDIKYRWTAKGKAYYNFISFAYKSTHQTFTSPK